LGSDQRRRKLNPEQFAQRSLDESLNL